MKLELVTLRGVKLSQEVYEVQIPTAAGDISVFSDHEPLITIAKPGVLMVRHSADDKDDEQDIFAIKGGAVHIQDNLVKVLVDEADHADDITASEAEAALERARQQRAGAKDAVSISEAEALVNRAAIRLKVAGLRRRRH
ncbi:MAG: ATP synthase F1 subunit epsilon [Candidatus Saccharimonadales bacterium]